MCGRYDLNDRPNTRDLFGTLGVPGDLVERFNIAPGGIGQIVYETPQGRVLEDAYWSLLIEPKPDGSGYRPNPKYSTFNAQSRRLTSSSLWKERYERQRAIIPASAFYEWTGEKGHKQCHRIQPVEGVIAFGGLYERWQFDDDLVTSFSIITLPPHPRFLHIHDKSIPLMLEEKDFSVWLDHSFIGIDAFVSLMAPHIPNELRIGIVASPSASMGYELEMIYADSGV